MPPDTLVFVRQPQEKIQRNNVNLKTPLSVVSFVDTIKFTVAVVDVVITVVTIAIIILINIEGNIRNLRFTIRCTRTSIRLSARLMEFPEGRKTVVFRPEPPTNDSQYTSAVSAFWSALPGEDTSGDGKRTRQQEL
ncbi:hypothetical protein RUM44_013341 [Polyplax serrata]|uniref:Uncharacterized protein n=1 Tax=Polyplax serrata TaxID=468196 RepID=A0ABR1BDW9_POLSC